MNETIRDNWNKVIKPQDKIYHLGDVYFGGASKDENIKFLKSLNGHKRLILGNHDNGKDQVLQHCFEKIDVWRMFPEYRLLLTHVPVHISTLNKSGRNGQPDFQLTNVHGHIHNRESPAGPYINVSVEMINYTPVSIEELIVKK